MENHGEKRKLKSFAEKKRQAKRAKWEREMRKTKKIHNLMDRFTYYNYEADYTLRAKIMFQICDADNKKRVIYIERLLKRYQKFMPMVEKYTEYEFPEELLRETHASFILLDLLRNVFMLDETSLEIMPMDVMEEMIFRMTQTKILFFNQYLVLKQYFKFYMSQKCFTIAKYFVILLKYTFVEYQRDLKEAFCEVQKQAKYDNHLLKLLFYDYNESVCSFMVEMIMHNEFEYTNHYIHENIHYDIDRGSKLLATLPSYKLNGDWLPSRILQYSDIITCSTIMETVSKAYLQFMLNLYPKFSLYRKAATRKPEIDKNKTIFLYHPVDIANQRKFMQYSAKYIRAVYQTNLYSKYTEIADVIKGMEPFKKFDHNRDHKWGIYKLIDNCYAHLWKLELNYFEGAMVDIPTKSRALVEITDKRLESGKYLMSCNGGFQADYDVLYDFVSFFILVRKDLQSAHDYALEILDNIKTSAELLVFVNSKSIVYKDDMDEEEFIDSIIQSVYRKAPKIAKISAQTK